jgi:hypothetical protein
VPPDTSGIRSPDDRGVGRFIPCLHPELVPVEKGQLEVDATGGVTHGVADDLTGEEGDDRVGVFATPFAEHGSDE